MIASFFMQSGDLVRLLFHFFLKSMTILVRGPDSFSELDRNENKVCKKEYARTHGKGCNNAVEIIWCNCIRLQRELYKLVTYNWNPLSVHGKVQKRVLV